MVVAVIAGLIFLPIVLMYLLRSNPSLAFLSLCAGVVLEVYAAQGLADMASKANLDFLSDEIVSITLVCLPLLITILLTAKSLVRSKMLMYIVPALATGALLTLSVVPLLPTTVRADYLGNNIYNDLHQYAGFVIAVGVFTSLLPLWLKRSHDGKHKKH